MAISNILNISTCISKLSNCALQGPLNPLKGSESPNNTFRGSGTLGPLRDPMATNTMARSSTEKALRTSVDKYFRGSADVSFPNGYDSNQDNQEWC